MLIILVYLLIILAVIIMIPSTHIGDIRLVDKMSKEQIQDYWLELKESRFESYFFREMYERVIKMNPNLVLPSEEEINNIEKDAMNIALWEENWDKMNKERILRGGVDYSIFRDKPMWVDPEYRISNNT
jgi:hypothetical protein